MHAVVRTYSGKGANELFDLLTKHKAEVEQIISGIKGFVGYTLIGTSAGCITVTVAQDKAGTDESVHKARDWIAKNASNTGVAAPKVTEGRVALHLP
jgi:hypothetical protein